MSIQTLTHSPGAGLPTARSLFKFAATIATSMMLALSPAQAEEKKATIELKAGKIIELAFYSVKEGKEAQLGQDYFPKVLPITAKYGGSMLGSFQVTKTVKGKISPQGIALFEWDTLERRDDAMAQNTIKQVPSPYCWFMDDC